MSVSVEQFRTEFPEFVNTSAGLLAGKIADAEALLNASAFGELHDEAVKYMAAHLVAMSPSGEFARLDANKEPDGARTIYERTYMQIRDRIAGPMVV